MVKILGLSENCRFDQISFRSRLQTMDLSIQNQALHLRYSWDESIYDQNIIRWSGSTLSQEKSGTFSSSLREISWDNGTGSGGCFMGVSELKGTTHFLRVFGAIILFERPCWPLIECRFYLPIKGHMAFYQNLD